MSEWFNAGRISPVPSGTWNDTAAYTRLDIVTDPNMQRSYIAKKSVPAGTPLTDADYWQLIVDAFHAVSLKTAADRLASPFSETSSAVACHPVEDYPLGVVTHIEPVQSGSGDPSPDNIRPITGHTGDVLTRCGKNLLQNKATTRTTNGVTFTVNNDGSITVDGTPTSGNATFIHTNELPLENGTYILNGCPAGGTGNTYSQHAYNLDGNKHTLSDTGSGVVVDFVNGGQYYNLAIVIFAGYTASNLVFKPMIRLASVTDATYEPYNAETFTADFGKNLANLTYRSTVPSISNGQETAAAGSNWASDYIAIDASRDMVFSVSEINDANNVYLLAYDNDKAYIGHVATPIKADSAAVYLKNISGYKSAKYCRLRLDALSTSTFKAQLEYGSTPTSFVPYNADLIAKTGGMVYGGELNWNTGVLTVDRALKSITGDEVVSWNRNSGWNAGSWYCGTILPGAEEIAGFGTVANMVCSHAPVKTPGLVAVTEGCIGYGNGTNLYVNFGAQYNTVSLLNEFFAAQYAAGTPVQITYKLATPITIQLTPQDILALGGVNTLYAEAGDVNVAGRISPIWMNEQLKSAIIALGGNV